MKKGFTFVELVVGIAILSLSFVGLIAVYNKYVQIAIKTTPTVQASYLLEEGVEVMKLLRDTSWTSRIAPLSTTTTYYLAFSTSTNAWTSTTTASLVDSTFARTVQVYDMKRDTNSDLSTTTGSYDPNTKLITVSVAWSYGATTTKSVSTYITNLFGN